MSATPDDITCRELVELVTDYLESALPPSDLARFEAHLKICEPCRDYVQQVRQMVMAAGRVGDDSLDARTRESLLESFRGWKRGEGL